MNTKSIIVLILLILLIGFGSGYFIGKGNRQYIVGKETVIKYDTVTIQKDIIRVVTKAKVRYVSEYKTISFKDTIYQVKPFVAEIDTIIRQDTINAKYVFPINQFDLTFKFGPEKVQTKYIYETITVSEQEKWYIKPLIIFSSVGAGYLLGRAR